MPRLTKNEKVLSVAELINHLRFGDWVVKVGMVMKQHDAKFAELTNVWASDGRLYVELAVHGDRPNRSSDSYPLESLMVIRSGTSFAPIYTLRGNVNVTVSDGNGHRRPAVRDRAIAAFQRQKPRKRARKARQDPRLRASGHKLLKRKSALRSAA